MIIHLIPKWLPFKYSFVFIQISPGCLVLKLKIQKNDLSWTRPQGPICIRINQRPFWNKVYTDKQNISIICRFTFYMVGELEYSENHYNIESPFDLIRRHLRTKTLASPGQLMAVPCTKYLMSMRFVWPTISLTIFGISSTRIQKEKLIIESSLKCFLRELELRGPRLHRPNFGRVKYG